MKRMQVDRWDRSPRWKPLDYAVAGVMVAVALGVCWAGYMVMWLLLG